MYKITEIKIDGFWQRYSASTHFNEDVNIIIGRNGTGKTTFMDILHSILTVDLDGLNRNDFHTVSMKLKNRKKKTRTITVEKIEDENNLVSNIEYRISNKKYALRLFSNEDRAFSVFHRRKNSKAVQEVRMAIKKLVSLSSLSVYRLRESSDFYEFDRRSYNPIINTVDYKLEELMQRLTKYQLELSQKAREIADTLQKDVLTSILYNEEDENDKYNYQFDKEKERRELLQAYDQLGLNTQNTSLSQKITFHIEKIDDSLKRLKNLKDSKSINFRPIEALRRTQRIIKKSLQAQKETTAIFNPIDSFLSILKKFIHDKSFTFDDGELLIQNEYGKINVESLSSGEKQLLILFIETLLQKKKEYIYLTDEPELSLHIQWQRNILPAIKELNPNAQVIAATHSPEVAAQYAHAIYDMEGIINE